MYTGLCVCGWKRHEVVSASIVDIGEVIMPQK